MYNCQFLGRRESIIRLVRTSVRVQALLENLTNDAFASLSVMKMSIISLHLTKLYVTQSFAMASSVTYCTAKSAKNFLTVYILSTCLSGGFSFSPTFCLLNCLALPPPFTHAGIYLIFAQPEAFHIPSVPSVYKPHNLYRQKVKPTTEGERGRGEGGGFTWETNKLCTLYRPPSESCTWETNKL